MIEKELDATSHRPSAKQKQSRQFRIQFLTTYITLIKILEGRRRREEQGEGKHPLKQNTVIPFSNLGFYCCLFVSIKHRLLYLFLPSSPAEKLMSLKSENVSTKNIPNWTYLMQIESFLILLEYTFRQPGHRGLKINICKHWQARLRSNKPIPQPPLFIPYKRGMCAEGHIKVCRHVKRGHSCWWHSEYLTNQVFPCKTVRDCDA